MTGRRRWRKYGTDFHARDCGGGCDGCGYITWRLRWLPGPTPWWARRFQRLRSEEGVRFARVEVVAS